MDVKIGSTYMINHTSGKGVKVKVVDINVYNPTFGTASVYSGRTVKASTRYRCINLKTGRAITIKSKSKFLCEVV